MRLLRTPDERFVDLPDYPYEPNYLVVDGIRIHYVDEGPKDGEVVLLMHGQPTWSYMYRHVIPIIVDAGYRAVAPDLVGFGRSDKPDSQGDHTYRRHLGWMTEWMRLLALERTTLACQDWGALIGLRVAVENQERFDRIVLSNALALPTGAEGMPEDSAFMKFRQFSRTTAVFDIERLIQGATITHLPNDVLKVYNAPFPDESYKAGPRIMPSLVPITTSDPEFEANTRAWERFERWEKPFLTAFSDKGPITGGDHEPWQERVPGAQGRNHPTIRGAGHFVAEDKGAELADVIVGLMQGSR